MKKYSMSYFGIWALCWMILAGGAGLHAQERDTNIPKRMWVLTVGPTWSQVTNSSVSISFEHSSYDAPYYDRILQPYMGIELFEHLNERWVYSVGLSYIERIANNLREDKLRFRSAAIELHGGVKLWDELGNDVPLFSLNQWMDSLIQSTYLTLGIYAGPVLRVEYLNGAAVAYPYTPWDMGIKLRFFSQFYKYRADDLRLPISIELGMSVSLLKVLGYRLWTVYWYFPKDTDVYALPWIFPMFRFSVTI